MLKLDRNIILSGIPQDIEINILDKIDSTNDYFSDPHSFSTPSICLAEQQIKGRGRIGRDWYSPHGSNIYLSLFYKFSNINEISSLSLVVGLAVLQAMDKIYCNNNFSVKWPNDIFCEGKKLGGVLIESKTIGEDVYVTAGIGINVNLSEDEGNIDNTWTSIRRITGKEEDRNQLVVEIVNNILSYYKHFQKSGFEYFMNMWNKKDLLQGKKIILDQGSEKIEGNCKGVDDTGNLLLCLKDGSIKSFNYGDTSIIKY